MMRVGKIHAYVASLCGLSFLLVLFQFHVVERLRYRTLLAVSSLLPPVEPIKTVRFPKEDEEEETGPSVLNCQESYEWIEKTVVENAEKQQLVVDPSKVVIVTIVGGWDTVKEDVRANRKAYASKHGYRYVQITSSKQASWPDVSEGFISLGKEWDRRNFAWGKVYALLDMFEQHPEVTHAFWIDADIMLMNHEVGLEFLIGLNKSFVASGDEHGVNTGAFLIRNDAWSRKMLDHALFVNYPPAPALEAKWWEQPALFVASMMEKWELNYDLFYLVWFREGKMKAQKLDEVNALNAKIPQVQRPHVLFLPQCVLNSREGFYRRGHFSLHFAGSDPRRKMQAIKDHAKTFLSSKAFVRTVALYSHPLRSEIVLPGEQSGRLRGPS